MPLRLVAKYWAEVKSEALLSEVAEILNATLSKVPKSQLPMQIELALARDEFYAWPGANLKRVRVPSSR